MNRSLLHSVLCAMKNVGMCTSYMVHYENQGCPVLMVCSPGQVSFSTPGFNIQMLLKALLTGSGHVDSPNKNGPFHFVDVVVLDLGQFPVLYSHPQIPESSLECSEVISSGHHSGQWNSTNPGERSTACPAACLGDWMTMATASLDTSVCVFV